jgi:hypothetical protein
MTLWFLGLLEAAYILLVYDAFLGVIAGDELGTEERASDETRSMESGWPDGKGSGMVGDNLSEMKTIDYVRV